jgi:dGTPase
MPIAGYAARDEQRWAPEPPKRPSRTAFARDRARVLHSAAWRRLAAKTQVMLAGEQDFPRTRMTHSLEVAQVGRELGAALGCDPDLVETACLAHDLGHPPFGHNGEEALDALCAGIGGFEGNAQTLRILTRLEAKSFGDPQGLGHEHSVGLNLTRAALDAAAKYPWPREAPGGKFGVYQDDLAVFSWMRAGAPPRERAIEAQVMDWADDVAYSVHDVEDGIHAGLVDLAALHDAATVNELARLAAAQYAPGTEPAALEAALARLLAAPFWPIGYTGSLRDLAALKDMASQLIGRFTAAAESATRDAHPGVALTRHHGALIVPEAIRDEVVVLKGIAYHFVMRRSGSERAYARQRALLQELVAALTLAAPDSLEPHFRPSWHAAPDDGARLRVVVDQVASLTDLSVVAWHRRHCR